MGGMIKLVKKEKKKLGFWERISINNKIADARDFEIRKIRARNKKVEVKESDSLSHFSFGKVVAVLLICLTVLGSAFFISVSYGVKSLSNSMESAIKSNPELGLYLEQAYGSYSINNDIITLSLLKQLDVDAQGEFYGEFETKKVRSIEKEDLSCVDKFNYKYITRVTEANKMTLSEEEAQSKESLWDVLIEHQQMKDNGCTEVITSGINLKKVMLYRCPQRNCKIIEVSYDEPISFVPKHIKVSSVKTIGD